MGTFNEAVRGAADRHARFKRRWWLRPVWLRYQVRRTRESYLPAWRRCTQRKSFLRVAAEVVAVTFAWRCLPFHYLRYGLYARGVEWQAVMNYLPESVLYYRIIPVTNTDELLLDDKVVFHKLLKAATIRQPAVRSMVRRGRSAATGTSGGHVVAKAARYASGGKRIHFFDLDDPNQSAEMAELYARAADERNDWIIEDRVNQHEALGALHPSSVNTLRVMTWFGPTGGARVLFVVAKIGVGGAETDNAHTGGVYVAVDADGSVRPPAWDEQHAFHENHPTTGLSFSGRRIPHIEAVFDLALRCAQEFPYCGLVGWDIAVDAEGPLVLEGNSSPGLTLVQRTHGGIASTITAAIGGNVRPGAD